MKKAFKGILWWTGVAVIGIAFGVSLQFAMAWIEPTLPPPGGNLGAPINTSSIWQTKLGGLTVPHLIASNTLVYPPGASKGKVLTSADANGWAAWQVPTFGGMYQTNNYTETPGCPGTPMVCRQVNPATDSCSCPAGFKAVPIFDFRRCSPPAAQYEWWWSASEYSQGTGGLMIFYCYPV